MVLGWSGEGKCKQTVEKRQHKSYIIKIMTGLGLARALRRGRRLLGGEVEAKPRNRQ